MIDGDGYGLICRVERVWHAVLVRGVGRGWSLKEDWFGDSLVQIQGYYQDEGYDKAQGKTATNQSIEGLVTFISQLHWNCKQVLPTN